MSTAYEGEGGVGGKFRRRPFRKSAVASTPYDRPPAADRASRFNDQRNGWISRLVDPASRMIVAGASRFFSSVFTKRLPPPPAIADAAPPSSSFAAVSPIPHNGKVTDADPNIRDVTNPIPISHSEMMPEGVSIKFTRDRADSVAITELELLMKQKTFTRDEFDRLTELLRSRTIDLPMEDEIRKSEPSTSKTETHSEKQEMDILAQENVTRDSKLLTVNTNVPEVENASPAELAKAYMGSKYSNLSPSISGLRYQPHRDASTLSLTGQSSNQTVAPRSIVHFSGLGDNGYKTPKPQGRSAIYKMSRSPYFKAQPIVSLQDCDPSGEGNLERNSSQQTPLTSGGKQVLKRRSSFIENESGSFGPIRRIRQKSNMVSPLNDSSFIRRSLSTQAVNGQQVSPLSASKHRLLGGPSHPTSVMEDAVDGIKKDFHENFASVSRQSSFMARKILQKLDHLVPSPKEKVPSVQKAISSDDSPSKLTFNMLNGHALNSVKDIDSSQLDNADESQKVSSSSGFFKHSSEAPISRIQDRLECNGPLKASTSGVKIFTEEGVSDSMAVLLANTKNGIKSDNKPGDVATDLVFSSAFAVPKKPSFSMQVPESPWELEADNNVGGNASDVAITVKDMPDASISQTKSSVVETTMKKPFPSYTESSDVENKVLDGSTVLNKDNDFKVTSNSQVRLSPYTTSSLQSSMNEKTDFLKVQASSPQKTQAFSQSASGSEQISTSLIPPKERTSAPVFSFGSKSTPVISFSSTATNASDSSSVKFTAKLDSKVEVTGSTAVIMTSSQTETPGSDECKEAEIVGQSSKSVGISVLSGSPTTTILSPICSAPITSAPSDCSLKLMPSEPASITPVTSSVLATPTVASFGTPRVSELASVPTLLPVSSHQEISGTTAISTGSATTVIKSTTTNELESKSSKGSSSSSSLMNFSTPAAVPTSSSGSSVFGFSFSAPTTAGSFPGQPLSTQPSQFGCGSSIFSQNSANQFGSTSSSFSLGLSSSSSSAFGSSMAGVKPFSFGSVSEPGQSFSRSFTASATASSISSSSETMNTASLFGSSQPSAPSVFGSGFAPGSSSSGFSFGTPTSSGGTSSMPFGATSGLAFSFTSAASNSASTPLSPPQTFGSSLAGNEQMSVEDSMTDDTVQTAMPIAPAFGQATTAPTPPISFGSPAVQPGGAMGFQFGSQQPSPAFPQAQSSFQPSGNLGFTAGGSFSLGSGGGDKSNRRIVKVKRTGKGRK